MSSNEMSYGPLCRVQGAHSVRHQNTQETVVGRADGRKKWDELRPIFLRGSVMSAAAGSSYIECGRTKVFCAVHGPRPFVSTHSIDGVLNCDIRWAEFSGNAGIFSTEGTNPTGLLPSTTPDTVSDEERELSRSLTRTLSAITRLQEYPKSRIDLCAFILEDDGGAFAAVISAASYALADAGIETLDVTAGCTAAIFDGQVIVDPSAREQKQASGAVVVSCTKSDARITGLIATGELPLDLLQQAIHACCAGALQICALMTSSLEKHAIKVFKQSKSGQ